MTSPPAQDQPDPPPFVEPDRLLALAPSFRDAFGTIESRITGHSMKSSLPQDARIRIRCGVPDGVGRDAVIAFLGGPTLIAHRVVRRGVGRRAHNFFITRGDATILCDAPIHRHSVLGTVTHVNTGSGWRQVPPLTRGPGARAVARVISTVVTVALVVDARAARAVTARLFQLRSIARRLRSHFARRSGAG